MVRSMFVALVAVALVLCFSTVTFAQEGAKPAEKKEMKQEMKPAEKKEMKHDTHQTMMSVSCDPDCGFMCRSHDEKELTSIVMNHAKTAHNKTLTEADVKKMMKTETPAKKM